MIFKSYLLEQNISKIQNNLVLFYGENLGMKDDFKRKIKKLNQKTYIKNLVQDEVLGSIEKFYNDVYNDSLFEEKKIFFINQVYDKILEIVKELEENGKKNIYFFSEILEKKSKLRTYFETSKSCAIVACYADNEITFKKIILEKLKNRDGLTPENINIIVENCNLDRSKLHNELNKIINNEEIYEHSLKFFKNWPYKLVKYDIEKIVNEGVQYQVSDKISISEEGSKLFLVDEKNKVPVPDKFTDIMKFSFDEIT